MISPDPKLSSMQCCAANFRELLAALPGDAQPRHAVPAELAYQGHRLPTRAYPPGRNQSPHHQHAAPAPRVASPVSVAFPAFVLGHEPQSIESFAISYGSELSLKHASDFRSIVQASWYRPSLSQRCGSRRSLEDEVVTSLRGFRKATSVGGALTGLGGNMIIIDDPQKPIDGAQSQLQA